MIEREDRAQLARKLLKNEMEFDQLFSRMESFDKLILFHNSSFAEDPVFNHFVVNDEVLDDPSVSEEQFAKIVGRIKEVSLSMNFRTSVFSEEIWRSSQSFEKVAVVNGFKIRDKMEILSKKLCETNALMTTPGVIVEETTDFAKWNDVFVCSFSIPHSWNEELLRREKEIVERKSATLLLATAPHDSKASGCLLALTSPKDLMGVYCVGTVPSSRGLGIARAMMSFAEGKARRRGCTRVTLQTVSSDGVSPMYRKMGYGIEFERIVLDAPPL